MGWLDARSQDVPRTVTVQEAVGLYLHELQEIYSGGALQRHARELTHFSRYAQSQGVSDVRTLDVSHVEGFLTGYYVRERLFEQAAGKRDVLSVMNRWLKWLKRRGVCQVYEDYRVVRGRVKSGYREALAMLRKSATGASGGGE